MLLDYPDVLAVFLPEIAPCVGFDQCNRHHIYDVWGHSAHAAAAIAPEPVLRWTMLLHDVGKPACFTRDEQGVGHFYGHPAVSAELAEGACRRLRMDSRSAERIVTLVRWHDRDIPRTDRAIARAVGKLGADDYLTKPFGPGELLARIRAALRHVRTAAGGEIGRTGVYRCGDLEVDCVRRRVRISGEDIHLTQSEYRILSLLVRHAGKVLTYDSILRELWGPSAGGSNQILRVNVANIRRVRSSR